jgi:hypothetical protein
MPSGTISLLRVGTNSAPINSEKSTTELNGPHFSGFGRPNLTLDLEIHQHLGSLKYVINIIMWIRDMGVTLITSVIPKLCKRQPFVPLLGVDMDKTSEEGF